MKYGTQPTPSKLWDVAIFELQDGAFDFGEVPRPGQATSARAGRYNRIMLLLHVGDSATHLGGASIFGFLIAGLGVAIGAFFVFGMPAVLGRRRGSTVVSDQSDENTERS